MQEKEINRQRQVHFGKILSNFTILLFVVLLLTAAIDLVQGIAYFIAVLVMLFLFMILLLSLFTLWSWFKSLDVGSWFDPDGSFTTFFAVIRNGLHTACPYLFGIAVVFAALSILLLTRDKNDKHVGRIVIAVLAVVVGVIAMIVTHMRGAI